MSKETLPTIAPITQPTAPSTTYVPSAETLSDFAWQAANFVTVVAVTSTSIALAQSPITSLMLNRIKYGRVLPLLSETNGGVLAAIRSLWVGSNFAGSGARTAYVTGAKKGEYGVEMIEDPPIMEESAHQRPKESTAAGKNVSNNVTTLGYIGAVSLGDVIITMPETLSQLRKLGIITNDFNWKDAYNFRKIATTGTCARFSAGMVNFSALCVGEEYIRGLMPAHLSGAHFISGVASGMTASIFSSPLSIYRDNVLAASRVVDGRLIVPSTAGFITDAITQAKAAGVRHTMELVAKEFAVQAPLRMARVGLTFGIVSEVGAMLGKTPLDTFNRPPPASGNGGGYPFGFFSKPADNERPCATEATPDIRPASRYYR